jgi:hypothetical protein
MTDILKDFPEKNASKVARYFRDNPETIMSHTTVFQQEIDDLKRGFCKNFDPVFLCFGAAAFDIVNSYFLSLKEKREIVRLRHYADFSRNREEHREEFLAAIKVFNFSPEIYHEVSPS